MTRFSSLQLFSLHKNVGLHPYQEMMKTCGRLTDCSTDFRVFSCLSEFENVQISVRKHCNIVVTVKKHFNSVVTVIFHSISL